MTPYPGGIPQLRGQVLHHMPMHIGQAETPALEGVGEAGVVDSKLVQNRCVEIVDGTVGNRRESR